MFCHWQARKVDKGGTKVIDLMFTQRQEINRVADAFLSDYAGTSQSDEDRILFAACQMFSQKKREDFKKQESGALKFQDSENAFFWKK